GVAKIPNHLSPKEILTSRNPILKELPRENSYFRRRPGLPNFCEDIARNHRRRNTNTQSSLEQNEGRFN
ncbi:hypothetical protein A2U01_0099022, partial [Trifolium medium]|nr:hypothetical protein [Trifolium medium]